MQNFCFRVVIFFVLRKVGFRLVQTCDFPIVWKILILLVFWRRITNYFLADFVLLSFDNSLTCVWFHRFRSLFRLFFSVIPLWATAEKLLSTIIGKLPTVWRGILQEFFQTPFTIYGHSKAILLGYFTKVFLNLLHYNWKVVAINTRFYKTFLSSIDNKP